MAHKTRYMFESYDQKLVVLVFVAFLHELLPTVLGSWGICMARKTRYMFESYDQKIVVLVFMAIFHELWPMVLGLMGDLHGP